MAAVVQPAVIDPTRPGKYPILIGEDLLREEKPRKRQRISVQYNHKPKSLDGQLATVKRSTSGQDVGYELSIQSPDEAGNYRYSGIQRPSTSLALTYDAAKQSFILDRVDAEFGFNLQSTPSNKDIKCLAVEHPHLSTGQAEENVNGLSAGDQEDEDPDSTSADPNNPYDYRHFLRRGASPSPQPSIQNSPVPNHAFNSSPLLRPPSPIRQPRSSTGPKKPKPQQRRRYLSPNPRGHPDAGNEESDPNELIIDMGDSEPGATKPWRSALAALNGGGRSSGPISLRSAASSMSPSVRGESDTEMNGRHDNDIEEIDLGVSRMDGAPDAGNVETSVNGNGWDEEDGDILEAELEHAMEQEAESEQQDHYQPAPPAESSSESEEE